MDDRRKLCWECGGEVPKSAEECPFCGAAFEVVKAEESESDAFFGTTNAGTDYYSDNEPPKPLYQPIDEGAPGEEEPTGEEKPDHASRQQLICLCFLIPGFALLLFGVILFFFSQEGYLTLKWDASWGMFVFALSAFFIYLGAKAYKKL